MRTQWIHTNIGVSVKSVVITRIFIQTISDNLIMKSSNTLETYIRERIITCQVYEIIISSACSERTFCRPRRSERFYESATTHSGIEKT